MKRYPAAWDGFVVNTTSKTDPRKVTRSVVGGLDKPLLAALFAGMRRGAYGPLDARRVVLRGWSSGAQMVSWLFQVFATGEGRRLFPGVRLAGGVLLSGGSYNW